VSTWRSTDGARELAIFVNSPTETAERTYFFKTVSSGARLLTLLSPDPAADLDAYCSVFDEWILGELPHEEELQRTLEERLGFE
jgi:hypothetical protein